MREKSRWGAQQFRALTALAEDQGSVSSTCMPAHNHLKFQFEGTDASSGFCGLLQRCGAHK